MYFFIEGVFTSIIRGLGIQGIEVEELYSLDPWAIDHVRFVSFTLYG